MLSWFSFFLFCFVVFICMFGVFSLSSTYKYVLIPVNQATVPSTLKQFKMLLQFSRLGFHCKRCHIKFISEENIYVLYYFCLKILGLLCYVKAQLPLLVLKNCSFFSWLLVCKAQILEVCILQYILYENRRRWSKIVQGSVYIRGFLLVSKCT